MHDPDLIARIDESRALTLALIERLSEKTQNYGAVRACEPLLTETDFKRILERTPALAQSFVEERRRAAGIQPSGLLLPPGATPP